jgi:putative membrane protein
MWLFVHGGCALQGGAARPLQRRAPAVTHPPSITNMTSSLAIAGDVLVGLTGALHVFIFNLESLTWFRGSGRSFGVKSEHLQPTANFAANQGFYNLILAAGCFWSLYTGDFNAKLFFTTSVFAAGIIGATLHRCVTHTASRRVDLLTITDLQLIIAREYVA